MNRPNSPRPKVRRQAPKGLPGLTLQQTLILAVIAVLGLVGLGLAAFMLLTDHSGSQSNSTTAIPSNTHIFPTSTPTILANQPPDGKNTLPSLPAGCTQKVVSFSQGTVTHVIDLGTLEVQVDGSTEQVGYAGISMISINSDSSPASAEAVRKARTRLEGKPVKLVKDVSEQDAQGRLPRYVFVDGQFINDEWVLQGLATVQPGSLDQSCAPLFQQSQQQARAERQGVWKLTPVPTHTFVPLVSLVPGTQIAGCDCSKRPTCSDFRTHAQAQACYNACQDYNSKLDDNHDGIACENLP